MSMNVGKGIVIDKLRMLFDAADRTSHIPGGTTWKNIVGQFHIDNVNRGHLTLDAASIGTVSGSRNGGVMAMAHGNNNNLTGGDLNLFDGENKVSVAIWFRVGESLGSNENHTAIFSKDNSLECWTRFNISTSTVPGMSINNNHVLISNNTLSTNTWYHGVWTADISGTDTRRFYLNGENDGNSTSGTQSSSTINDTANVLTVGGRPAEYIFTGLIAHVAVYCGKALSNTEVKQNFNAHRHRFGL